MGISLTPPPGNLTATTEQIQDVVGAFIAAGTNTTVVYDDGLGTLTITATGAQTDEQVRDLVATFLAAGANVTVTHDDAGNTLTVAVANEAIDDRVAALCVAGTNISVTYDDAANTLTFANLYGNEQVDDRINALIVAGDGLTATYDDTAGTYTLDALPRAPIVGGIPVDTDFGTVENGMIAISRLDNSIWYRDSGVWQRVGTQPAASPYQDFTVAAGKAFATTGDGVIAGLASGDNWVWRGINARTNCYTDQWPQSRWDKFGPLAGTGKNDPQTLYSSTRPFNVVRIAMGWRDFEGAAALGGATARGTFSTTAISQLDTQIDRAITAGFKVILDPIHVKSSESFPSFAGSSLSGDNVDTLQADVSSDGNYALAWLRFICQRYSTNRDVIAVDLINEPQHRSAGFVDNQTLMQMFAELVTALRLDSTTTLDKILTITPCTGNSALVSTGLSLPTTTGPILVDWAVDFPTSVRANVNGTFHHYYGGGGTGAGAYNGSNNNGWSTSGFRGGQDLSSTGSTDYNLDATAVGGHLDRVNAWCAVPSIPWWIGEYSIRGGLTNTNTFCVDLTAKIASLGISAAWWDMYSADVNGQSYHGLNLLKSPSPGTWDTNRLTRILA